MLPDILGNSDTNSPTCNYLQWEETDVSKENWYKHGENMQTLQAQIAPKKHKESMKETTFHEGLFSCSGICAHTLV